MHLCRIAKIRRLLSVKAEEQLIRAFITSRLDLCNSLLTDLPWSTLQCVQLVQNAAAHLLTTFKRSDHIIPIVYTSLDTSWLQNSVQNNSCHIPVTSWLCPNLSQEHATTLLCQAGFEVDQQHSLCSSDPLSQLLSQLWLFQPLPPTSWTPFLKIWE